MRRADRLFRIVQLLRPQRVVTAARLSRELEVSKRTVYRDVADLIASGVPIEGEAGVGYCLSKGFELPPLMFDAEEIKALVLGARMVQAFGDERLARHARSVLSKVELVVPERLRKSFGQPELNVWSGLSARERERLEGVRRALDAKKKLSFRYRDEKGAESERTVRPLCLAFWGSRWTAGAWCELRRDFRNFRPDRMHELAVLEEPIPDDPAKDLAAYLRSLREELRREAGGEPARMP